MKAAIIGSTNLSHLGGGEVNAIMTAELLKEIGYEVTLYGFGDRRNFTKYAFSNLGFHYVPDAFKGNIFTHPAIMEITNLKSMGLVGLLSIKNLLEKLKDCDLVYFMYPSIVSSRLAPILANKKIMVIIGNHGTFFESLKTWGVLGEAVSYLIGFLLLGKISALKNNIKIHVQNSFQSNFYLRIGFEKNLIFEIPQNNVDFSKYNCKRNEGAFKVCFLGRMVKGKGVDVLLGIIKKYRDIEIFIIGEGPLLRRLQSVAEKKKRKNVHVLSRVSEEQKRDILSNCDAMIVPSISDSLSIATIEGIASGLHIITSDKSNGPRYIISKSPLMGRIVKRKAAAFHEEIISLSRFKERDSADFERRKEIRKTTGQLMFDRRAIEKSMKSMFQGKHESHAMPAGEGVENLYSFVGLKRV